MAQPTFRDSRLVATVLAAACLMLATAGCGERDASAREAARSSAQPAWEAAANPFVVPGWKSGDEVSWRNQLAQRALNQNEFLRMH